MRPRMIYTGIRVKDMDQSVAFSPQVDVIASASGTYQEGRSEESDGHRPRYRKLMGLLLILVIAGPVVLVLSYSLVHAVAPNANPSLILVPLILTALIVVAVALVIAFVIQKRGRGADDAGGSPSPTPRRGLFPPIGVFVSGHRRFSSKLSRGDGPVRRGRQEQRRLRFRSCPLVGRCEGLSSFG